MASRKKKARPKTNPAPASAAASVPDAAVFSVSAPVPGWRWWLAGVTLLGLVIRAVGLGHADLWVDEILFVWMSLPPASMWDVAVQHYQQFPSIGHLPLGAMLQNGYLHLVGGTPDALQHAPLIQRVPAVIWGSLAIPALMMAIRRLVSA
ncbi:MAG: hypothetical protein KDL10_01915, partial [Kiritimatiellae bacterium]|nr:hypothetical protein [Kiritimatiellia bacterium]